MRRLHATAGYLLAAACVTAAAVTSAKQAATPTAPVRPSPTDNFVYVKQGKLGTRRVTPEGTVTTVSGDVIFAYRDTLLRTELANYNDRTQVAVSPGRVRIDDAQNTVVGSRGVAYYKRRTAEITGGVRITARPRPEDRAAPEGSLRREFRDPVTITCDKVVYNWRTRVAAGTGRLILRQKDRTVTADNGVYEGREERVTLTGNVRAVTKAGDVLLTDRAVAILREGQEELRIDNLKPGTRFPVDDDEDDAAPATTPAPSVTPATGNRRP
jgi:lipopolysaccharide assembly outer membrane protein LptD (OstA)